MDIYYELYYVHVITIGVLAVTPTLDHGKEWVEESKEEYSKGSLMQIIDLFPRQNYVEVTRDFTSERASGPYTQTLGGNKTTLL